MFLTLNFYNLRLEYLERYFKMRSKVKKKSAKRKNKMLFNKVEIFTVIILIIIIINYFLLNKYLNMLLIFFGLMSVLTFLMCIVNLIFEKKENKVKYINYILDLNIIIHYLASGIMFGQICKCGFHYFHFVPVLIFLLVELLFYHIYVYNYKKKKNMKYLFLCLLVMNASFVLVMFLSKVNMIKLHNERYNQL